MWWGIFPTRKTKTVRVLGVGVLYWVKLQLTKNEMGRCQLQDNSWERGRSTCSPLVPASCPLVCPAEYPELRITWGTQLNKFIHSNCCVIQNADLFTYNEHDFTHRQAYAESQIITKMLLINLF